MNILVINGPNLNLLGIREKDIYGTKDYNALIDFCKESAASLGVSVSFFQSNHEGAIVDVIQEAMGVYDGIVINPAAYTHTSVAIPDAVKAVSIPTVEVHISDVDRREEFRKISYIRQACIDSFYGYGFDGYRMAMEVLVKHHESIDTGK